eukprot:Transcript_23367.p1 GENE.Transcript_23367~~Transcript_23367.p1  ORF type:complete len:612 (+),score=220.11 Transcript_23367:148-1983(+)
MSGRDTPPPCPPTTDERGKKRQRREPPALLPEEPARPSDPVAATLSQSQPSSSSSASSRSGPPVMPPDDGSHLTVVSGDQQNFYVDREMFFEASTFVRNAIADTAGDVPLTLPPWVGSRSLRSALQHTRWHASRKPSTTLEEAATWDRNFIMTVAASSQEALLSLLRTASYLEMERLITLICRHLCVAMRKHSRAEIRELFPMLSAAEGGGGDCAQPSPRGSGVSAAGPSGGEPDVAQPATLASFPGCLDALEAHLRTVSEEETMRMLHLAPTALPALAELQVARALREAEWSGVEQLTVVRRLPNRRSATTTAEVRNVQTGTRAVLKTVRFDPEGVPVVALREIALLKALSHPNLVELKGAWCGGPHSEVVDNPCYVSLVYEYVEANLRHVIRSLAPAVLPLAAVKAVAFQALRGLNWCHHSNVLHRDLTPHNLRFCPATGTVKLTGFELAREIGSVHKEKASLTHEVVTLWYRAPEVLLGSEHYSSPLDAWSMGAVLAELATGIPLLPGDSEIGQLVKTFKLFGTPTDATWPGVSALPNFAPTFPSFQPTSLEEKLPQLAGDGVALVKSLMQHDPKRRLLLVDALEHPFFNDVDKVHVGTRPIEGMPAP